MRQYLDAKQQHRDAILLFRMGDFYEMFYEDALVAARALELTLTSRSPRSTRSRRWRAPIERRARSWRHGWTRIATMCSRRCIA